MATNDNRKLTPSMDYPLDENGRPVQKIISQPPTQTQPAPQTQPVQATPVQTAPQTDPFADYQRQAQQQYATTLADIRKRRQELEAKYQPDIERQRKIMKIMALGKLIGQLGQLAGGGAGTPVVDKDPYQINAWNELNRMRNEQRYYGQQLDAEERAAMRNMQTGLNRLALENAKQKATMAQIQERARLTQETNAKRQAAQAELEKIKIQARIDLKNLGYEQALKLMEQRFKNSAALKQMGFDNQENLAYLRASLDADKREDNMNTTTVVTTTKDAAGNQQRTTTKSGSVTRPKRQVWGNNSSGKKKVWK